MGFFEFLILGFFCWFFYSLTPHGKQTLQKIRDSQSKNKQENKSDLSPISKNQEGDYLVIDTQSDGFYGYLEAVEKSNGGWLATFEDVESYKELTFDVSDLVMIKNRKGEYFNHEDEIINEFKSLKPYIFRNQYEGMDDDNYFEHPDEEIADFYIDYYKDGDVSEREIVMLSYFESDIGVKYIKAVDLSKNAVRTYKVINIHKLTTDDSELVDTDEINKELEKWTTKNN